MNIHSDTPPQPSPSEYILPNQPPLAERPAEEQDEFSFSGLSRTLWLNKWGIVLTTALFAGLSAWSVYTKTPLYTATALVVLETEEKKVVSFDSVGPRVSSDNTAMNTEIEVLRSRGLMDRTVATLALDADPEFNPWLRTEPGWREKFGYDRILEALGVPPAPDAPAPTPEQVRQKMIDILLDQLRVSIITKTHVFEISVETAAARKSARIANTIAELYVLNQREAKFEAMSQAMVWLSDRVVGLKTELEAAEAAVEDYASNASLVSEEALGVIARQLKSLRERLVEQTEAATRIQARIVRLEVLRAAEDFATLAEILQEPRLAALARDFEAAAPGAAALARFDTFFGRLLEKLRSQAERADSQVAAFRRTVPEIEAQVEAQSADLVTLRQLQREAEATRLIYEYFLGRMKEISVQEGIQQADSRVLSPAKIPTVTSYPKIRQTIIRGGFIGLIVSILLIYGRNALRTTIRTPEELEAATGLTVMGMIPNAPVRNARALLDYMVKKPASGAAEAVRNLRTAILLSNVDSVPQVIMVTSSVPDEGKTVMAAVLAQTSVMSGKRVLLIDGDLRRRALTKQFDVGTNLGVVALLSGNASFEEAVHHDEKTGLDILTADESKVTAVDVFASKRYEKFIQKMRQNYDFIVIDTPPVLAVPDARVIAQNVDFVAYMVRWNTTTRRMIRAGLDLLAQVNVPVAGLTLTRIDPRRMDRYGYYGYGYGYGARGIEKYYTN